MQADTNARIRLAVADRRADGRFAGRQFGNRQAAGIGNDGQRFTGPHAEAPAHSATAQIKREKNAMVSPETLTRSGKPAAKNAEPGDIHDKGQTR